MRDTHVRESGMIPGATWEESVLVPVPPAEIASMEMLYGQRREIVCRRELTREEIDGAEAYSDKNGRHIGYRISWLLSASETIRFLPQSEYRVQAKIVTTEGTVKKSYMVYGITGDTDEYALGEDEDE